MSCCPPAPQINVGGSGDEDFAAQDTEIRRGESVECYMNRSGNTTGRHDDKTDTVPNTIANTDVPLTPAGAVDVTFKMSLVNAQQASTTPVRTASSWKLFVETNEVTSLGSSNSVTFTSNGSTARLVGEFAPADMGKSFKIKVSAYDSTGEIDQRGFTFSPAKSTGSNEIQFVHPLPGSRVTSKFGPRRPPASGASSQHGGADFAYAGGVTKDVLSAADGEVIFTGFQNGGAGNYVKVKHLNGAGKELCTTVYMHLNKIYVSTGQKVTAGQKIGLEGNTGIGTGAHLHFECRLPSGTKIDPVPLIKGELQVAELTDASNNGVVYAPTGPQNNVLTAENVQAKENGCEPFGPEYPKPKEPETTDQPPPAPITDPFERAWFFTMTHEVGPHWTAAFPSDPEVAAGLIETAAQRKKTGFVNDPNDKGGTTKFGIAQGSNPQLQVRTMPYDPAKMTGYNNYWKKGGVPPSTLAVSKPKTAIMIFDMNYLHGAGNANTIRKAANIDGMLDTEAIVALSEAQQNFMRGIVLANPSRQRYINGWLKRSRELLSYVQSL